MSNAISTEPLLHLRWEVHAKLRENNPDDNPSFVCEEAIIADDKSKLIPISVVHNPDVVCSPNTYRIRGVSLCYRERATENEDATAVLNFDIYEQTVSAKPDGFEELEPGPKGIMVRVGTLKAGEFAELTDRDINGLAELLIIVGAKLVGSLRRDEPPPSLFNYFLENPVLAWATADCWLLSLTIENAQNIAAKVAPEASEADRDRLATELLAEIMRFRRELPDRRLKAAIETKDSIPLWDAALADWLEKLGAKTDASKLREKRKNLSVRKMWSAWLPTDVDDTPKGILLLATVLWDLKVKPALEAEKRKPAALVVPVMYEAMDLLSRGRSFDQSSGQLSFAGREIARVIEEEDAVAGVDILVLLAGLGLLGNKLSHEVFRYEVFEAHNRARKGDPYPNILTIDGGWVGLTEILRYNPKKYATDVKNIIYAEAHLRFAFPDGAYGNLLSYIERPAVGRNGTAQVTLTIGSPLLPHYAFAIEERMGKVGLLARQARKLVPMPRHLPPFYGRVNEQGQQASYQLALMTAFRENAIEIATEGSVRLELDKLTALADRVSLPRRLIAPVVEHWTHDGKDNPAFLVRTEDNRYTLAQEHETELAFIIEAGKREIYSKKRGEASARAREASQIPKKTRRKRS